MLSLLCCVLALTLEHCLGRRRVALFLVTCHLVIWLCLPSLCLGLDDFYPRWRFRKVRSGSGKDAQSFEFNFVAPMKGRHLSIYHARTRPQQLSTALEHASYTRQK